MSSIIRGVIYGDGDLSELVGVLVEAIANGDATRLAHSREERAVKRCRILTRRRLAGKVDITGRFREFDVILTVVVVEHELYEPSRARLDATP